MTNPLHAAMIAILLAATGLPATATEPRPMGDDPRVLEYIYDARNVFELRAAPGFVTTIRFRSDEKIEGVSAGDTLGWEIVPAGNRRVLFLKPLDRDAVPTNLTVITSERLYSFAIEVDPSTRYIGGGDPTFLIQFTYPREEAREMARILEIKAQTEADRRNQIPSGLPSERRVAPEDWNFNYTYRGPETLRPVKVFDDGEKTYFEFSEHIRRPAIFAVDPQGNESLVNFDVRGRYHVVHAMQRQFTVRDGVSQLCIYNKNFPGARPEPLAPRLDKAFEFIGDLWGKS